MGNVQLLGNLNKERIALHGSPFIPEIIRELVAKPSVPWFLITEDLPDQNNRVYVKNEKIILNYTNNNIEAFTRLKMRWIEVLKAIDQRNRMDFCSFYITEKLTLKEVGHQCGTCRFGESPKTSVLDLNCRTHDVDNLYIIDSSFFPSSAAVNPSLTIIANALRVGNHLIERMGISKFF